jgi:hypothetical protein
VPEKVGPVGAVRRTDRFSREEVDAMLSAQRQQIESSLWLTNVQAGLEQLGARIDEMSTRLTTEIGAVRSEITTARGEFASAQTAMAGIRDDFEKRLAGVRLDMEEQSREMREVHRVVRAFKSDELGPKEVAQFVPLMELVGPKMGVLARVLEKEEAGQYLQAAEGHRARISDTRWGRAGIIGAFLSGTVALIAALLGAIIWIAAHVGWH